MKARIAALLAFVFLGSSLLLADTAGYLQTNLVSDGSVSALHTDSQLINPWGIAESSGSPFWVGDNGSGVSTLYNTAGVKQGIVVTIPPGGGTGAPTGVVFNGVAANFNGDNFLFATENGQLAGWRGALGTTAEVLGSSAGADYTGIAISGNQAYLADNVGNKIDVYTSGQNTPSASYTDSTVPAGYAPFNVQIIGGKVYVTYALTAGGGVGDGFVDVFDPVTHTFTRLISNGVLADPWGLALAPTTFGQFGGDLLVGNFADGTINAFDANSGSYLGTLMTPGGTDISNESLWGLQFGNGGNGGDKNTLYFTAGLANEEHGLFGAIAPVPEPTSMVLLGSGLAGVIMRRRRAAKG